MTEAATTTTRTPAPAVGRRRTRSAPPPPPLRLLGALALLLLPRACAAGGPVDYFPLNSQLPPVARVGAAFSFVFSPQTFASSSGNGDNNLTYALAEPAPPWLSLDGAARRLYGTPSASDVDFGPAHDDNNVAGVPIGLVATDATGSTTANATLVVSRSPPPTVAVPLAEQMPRFGPYSAPASLLLYPSRPFSFSFDRHTSSSRKRDGTEADAGAADASSSSSSDSSSQLSYYAVSADNAPLPSWVSFEAATLSFSGSTPSFESLVQPPQTFAFRLVASDVVGFSASSLDFDVVVGNHELTAKPAAVVRLNATAGRPFAYAGLRHALRIDNRTLGADDVASISATGLPPWLEFDERTWNVSGTPGGDAEDANVTIAVTDKFSDSLNVTLEIDLRAKIFKSDLPDLNVTAGDDFSFDLEKYLVDPNDTSVSIRSEPQGSWIHFDTSNLTLSGTVPKPDSKSVANEVKVTFNATLKNSTDTEEKRLDMHILPPTTSPGASKPTQSSDADPGEPSRDLYWLLLIPAFIIPALVILAVFYTWRRRQRQKVVAVDIKQVSAPVPGSFKSSGGGAGGLPRNVHSMLDVGRLPFEGSAHPNSALPHALTTDLQSSSTNLGHQAIGEGETSFLPHAMTAPAGANAADQPTDFWKRPFSPIKTGIAITDEGSLLSDTSLGENDHVAEADRVAMPGSEQHNPRTQPKGQIGLEIPLIAEPFSIQPTPELAYKAPRNRYDYSSEDGSSLDAEYPRRRRSSPQQQQRDAGLSPRALGHRISRAWKGGLLSDKHREGNQSTSTGLTTRTSILTSPMTTEEATTTTTANVVARPTVIHIPSRPGEARQVSRRAGETTPLFGGGSVTKSSRNFGLASTRDTSAATTSHDVDIHHVTMPEPPPMLTDDFALRQSRDSDTSWDKLARNSLGIAYKDLISSESSQQQLQQQHQKRRSGAASSPLLPPPPPALIPSRSENWRAYRDHQHTSQELMSPDQWPIPDAFGSGPPLAGIAITSSEAPPLRSRSEEPPQLPPLPPFMPPPPPPPTRSSAKQRRSGRSVRRGAREEQQEQPSGGFDVYTSGSPPDDGEWGRQRPLPRTPGGGRAPLGDCTSNGSNVGLGGRGGGGGGGAGQGLGTRSAASKRSQRTVRSYKSTRSVWTNAEEDDDDAWTDIVPAESTVGGWDDDDDGASDRSFSVYI
ncbi:hypothetical protein GGR56DRAFT_667197 [Xylariaceae sp. FL0804]|nr:hypothetical protein GGR56DRAFT_667197 [Xylariaceae sp. FL0804]